MLVPTSTCRTNFYFHYKTNNGLAVFLDHKHHKRIHNFRAIEAKIKNVGTKQPFIVIISPSTLAQHPYTFKTTS